MVCNIQTQKTHASKKVKIFIFLCTIDMCILPVPFFSRCINFVGFTAHPYQNYPELPLPPREEKDGFLKKKAIFRYKVGA